MPRQIDPAPRSRLDVLRILSDRPAFCGLTGYEYPAAGPGDEPHYGFARTLPMGATWYAIRQPDGTITATEV